MTMEAEGIKALVGLQLEKAHRFLAQADEMYSMQYWDLAANRYYLDESGEVHLSEVIRKIQIPSEKWNEQGVLMYNMDAIIAVGYRVNSYEATQFRIWAPRCGLC